MQLSTSTVGCVLAARLRLLLGLPDAGSPAVHAMARALQRRAKELQPHEVSPIQLMQQLAFGCKLCDLALQNAEQRG